MEKTGMEEYLSMMVYSDSFLNRALNLASIMMYVRSVALSKNSFNKEMIRNVTTKYNNR